MRLLAGDSGSTERALDISTALLADFGGLRPPIERVVEELAALAGSDRPDVEEEANVRAS